MFFDDPYRVSERNNYPVELAADLKRLQYRFQSRRQVAQLMHLFLSSPQSLLNGDVHTGSIVIDVNQP